MVSINSTRKTHRKVHQTRARCISVTLLPPRKFSSSTQVTKLDINLTWRQGQLLRWDISRLPLYSHLRGGWLYVKGRIYVNRLFIAVSSFTRVYLALLLLNHIVIPRGESGANASARIILQYPVGSGFIASEIT